MAALIHLQPFFRHTHGRHPCHETSFLAVQDNPEAEILIKAFIDPGIAAIRAERPSSMVFLPSFTGCARSLSRIRGWEYVLPVLYLLVFGRMQRYCGRSP